MSGAMQSDPGTRTRRGEMASQHVEPTGMTGWVGWVAFAGVMMTILGTFHVFDGLVAIFKDEYFLVGKQGLVVNVDYTVWGWVHLLAGVLIIAAGVAVFSGKVWARTIGVMLATLSAVLNIAFLSAYPIWSSIMILIDILVIWALTVHGGELRDDY
jgi:hypothetical protein